jgi:two-component system sensor histidine kinase DctS
MPRVLVVDGEPSRRSIMADTMQRGGYDALIASDYAGAREIIAQHEIDAAVIDIISPRRSGLELLRQLHEPYIPVIVTTSHADLAHLSELVRFGVYEFISKPVTETELLRAVSNAVEKKHLVYLKERLELEIRQHTEQLEQAVAERTRELAEAHSFLNTVLDSSTEYAIIALDTDGRILLFNHGAEMMFGHRPQQMVNHSIDELIGHAAVGAVQPMVVRACAAIPQGCSEEIELRRADGGLFIGSVTITPIKKPEDELIGFLCLVKDMTADRRSQARMQQLHERLAHNEKIAALGRMAAQVAHEVKNPLAGMRLYAMHLRSKVADKLADNELAIIDKITDAINKLSNTTEQVLSFARPVNLTRRPADLNAIVKDALSLLEPQALAKSIKVTLYLSPTGAAASFDEAAMRSTLINLLLNAIQAMNDGGSLRVATTNGGGEVKLTIEDDGCGMTAEQVQNMFEPFYTTKSQGLGLGMSLAAKVIEQHGGSVQVDSRVSRGTQVKITLPVNGDDPDEALCPNPHRR